MQLIYDFEISSIELFESLVAEGDKINEDFLYSAYSGLASVYVEKNEWKKAKEYLELAKSIYVGEPYIVDLEKKINKKLK